MTKNEIILMIGLIVFFSLYFGSIFYMVGDLGKKIGEILRRLK